MLVIQHLPVEVSVPHVVDGAAGPPHQHGPRPEQGQHVQGGEAAGGCGQPDAPGAGKVQQPRSFNQKSR